MLGHSRVSYHEYSLPNRKTEESEGLLKTRLISVTDIDKKELEFVNETRSRQSQLRQMPVVLGSVFSNQKIRIVFIFFCAL